MLYEAKKQVDEIKRKYGDTLNLVVIQVGNNPASNVYVKNKVKVCDEVGIDSNVVKLPESATYEQVKKAIKQYNRDDNCHAILLQLPLPAHLKEYEQELIDMIYHKKDVDGLTSANMGKLWSGEYGITPCTPTGILRLLDTDLSGKVVTIVGRSKLAGNPLIKLLQDRNATVISCHSKTDELEAFTSLSDIVITAIGKAKHFNWWYFEDDTTIIDVGINRDENGKLCGDVNIDSLEGYEVKVTPVPRGVGLLTTAQLMLNTIKCYKLQHK